MFTWPLLIFIFKMCERLKIIDDLTLKSKLPGCLNFVFIEIKHLS